ncbi:MAG: S8 family serine peptidase [Planctomycetota bacterium]
MLIPTLIASLAPVQATTPLDTDVQQAPGALETPYELVPDRLTLGLIDPSTDAAAWLATLDVAPLVGARLLRANRLGHLDLELADGSLREAALAALQARADVRFAERVWLGQYIGVPNDPLFSNQDHLRNLGQTGGVVDADVDAEHAWDVTTGDPSIIIAVIDSGTEVTHVDLVGNVWNNPGEVPGNGIDDDSNGFVDDAQGWSFENGNGNPAGGSHGTWVAGVIGARTGNGVGVAGLAGGNGAERGCSVMPLGVGSFAPSSDLLDDAILYAADNGAQVITFSLSVPASAAVDAAIDAAVNGNGLFMDCAVGNGFFGPGPVAYPANNPNVVAVGGTTHDGVYWTGANQGPETLISAQAENVFTTAVGGNYEAVSGTSFSAPLIGALAGLILSVDPTLTNDQVTQIMIATARDVGASGFDNQTGFGVVNAWEAVLAALEPDCDGNGEIDVWEIFQGTAVDADRDGTIDACQSLFPGSVRRSLGSGIDVAFTLDADPAVSANDFYYLLGSLTGPNPGVDLGGPVLPLVPDVYTDITLDSGAHGFLTGFAGVLDANGDASASFNLPAGSAPSIAGRVAYHAFLTIDAVTLAFDATSNPARIEFLP